MKSILIFFKRMAIQRQVYKLLPIVRHIRDDLRYIQFKVWLEIKPSELPLYKKMHRKKMFKVYSTPWGKKRFLISLSDPISNVTVAPCLSPKYIERDNAF